MSDVRMKPKKHGQVGFDKKCYQDAVLVSFTATPPDITTVTHTGERIYSPSSSKSKGYPTKLRSSFGVT